MAMTNISETTEIISDERVTPRASEEGEDQRAAPHNNAQ